MLRFWALRRAFLRCLIRPDKEEVIGLVGAPKLPGAEGAQLIEREAGEHGQNVVREGVMHPGEILRDILGQEEARSDLCVGSQGADFLLRKRMQRVGVAFAILIGIHPESVWF